MSIGDKNYRHRNHSDVHRSARRSGIKITHRQISPTASPPPMHVLGKILLERGGATCCFARQPKSIHSSRLFSIEPWWNPSLVFLLVLSLSLHGAECASDKISKLSLLVELVASSNLSISTSNSTSMSPLSPSHPRLVYQIIFIT